MRTANSLSRVACVGALALALSGCGPKQEPVKTSIEAVVGNSASIVNNKMIIVEGVPSDAIVATPIFNSLSKELNSRTYVGFVLSDAGKEVLCSGWYAVKEIPCDTVPYELGVLLKRHQHEGKIVVTGKYTGEKLTPYKIVVAGKEFVLQKE